MSITFFSFHLGNIPLKNLGRNDLRSTWDFRGQSILYYDCFTCLSLSTCVDGDHVLPTYLIWSSQKALHFLRKHSIDL